MAVLKGARVNKVGSGQWGRYIAVKHDDFDGFINVKDDSIDLDGIEKGSIIDVVGEFKGKGLNAQKVRLSAGGPAAAKGAAAAPAAQGGGNSRYSDATQQSIVMQHAQKVSAQLVTLFVDKGVIKLGAQAKQHAQLLELFDELSAHIFSTAQGAGLQATVEEQAALRAELDPANDADADADTPSKEEPADKDAGGSDFDDDFDDDFDETK